MAVKRRIRGAGANETEIRRALQHADTHNLNLTLSGADLGSLATVTVMVAGDLMVIVHDAGPGPALHTIAWTNFVSEVYAEIEDGIAESVVARWALVRADAYTATPASTSQLTMSDTTMMEIGLPVRYTIDGAARYGIITTVVEDTSIAVAGASLSGDVTALSVGTPEMVVVERFFVPGTYGDDVDDLLVGDVHTFYEWDRAPGYAVLFAVVHCEGDTGADNPKVNVAVGGDALSTADGGAGVQVDDSWRDNEAVAIDTAAYRMVWGDDLEVRCTVAGSNGDAEDLTVHVIFVLE